MAGIVNAGASGSWLRRWWRRLADIGELESVPWWISVLTGGDATRGEAPTVAWRLQGRVPMLRRGSESRLWYRTLAPEAGTLDLITLAAVPAGAVVFIDGRRWRVESVQEQHPYGVCRLLRCRPVEVSP